MSNQVSHEPLKIVEIDVGSEEDMEEAAHAERRAIIDMMRSERMVMPVHVASLSPNGDGCLYRYENYNFGVTVAEYDAEEMAVFPNHYLLVDSKGKTARIIVRERRGS